MNLKEPERSRKEVTTKCERSVIVVANKCIISAEEAKVDGKKCEIEGTKWNRS